MFAFSDFPYCFGESTKKYKLWNFSGFSEKKFSDHKKAPKLSLDSIKRRWYSCKKLMLVILAIRSLYRSLNFFSCENSFLEVAVFQRVSYFLAILQPSNQKLTLIQANIYLRTIIITLATFLGVKQKASGKKSRYTWKITFFYGTFHFFLGLPVCPFKIKFFHFLNIFFGTKLSLFSHGMKT